MLKRRSSRSGNLAVKVLGSLVVLFVLGLAMYVALPNKATTENGGAASSPAKGDDKARRCEDQLADLVEALSPGRLGISSDRVQLIDRLNSWRQECGVLAADVKPSTDQALLKEKFAGDTLTRALSDRYLAEDASHIRMSLLARDIAAHVVEGKVSNIDRAVSLFDYVCRNVMLINQELRQTAPLTPYESLVFGLGSAEDRAWIFADLLRQIRVDCVVITPQTDGKAEHWLVGVIDPEKGVLLFDSRLGLPIPAAGSPTDTNYPKVPATLSEVVETDAAFRQLDLPDDPYPLSSADLKNPRISLIGTTSTWAPRTAQLQFLLPQGISVELYDGLGANELRSPGMLQRVVDAGKDGLWAADQVSIWEHPEKAEREFEKTRGEGEEDSLLRNFQFVFRGPYVPRPIDQEEKEFRPTPIDKSLHYVRVEQLRGRYTDAIRDYLPIRTTEKIVPSPANQMAAEFGTLWTGVCQYDTQKIRIALGTFDRYAVSQARNIGMSRTAIEYLADCMLAQKNYESAVIVLMRAPPGFAPRRDRYLIERWMKIGNLTQEAIDNKIKELEKEAAAMSGQTQPPEEEKKPGEAPAGEMKKPDANPGDKAEMKPEAKSEEAPAAEMKKPASPAEKVEGAEKTELGTPSSASGVLPPNSPDPAPEPPQPVAKP